MVRAAAGVPAEFQRRGRRTRSPPLRRTRTRPAGQRPPRTSSASTILLTVSQVPAGPGASGNLARNSSSASPARVFFCVVSLRLAIIWLMVSLSATHLAGRLTLIERVRSRLVDGVATSAMARTCVGEVPRQQVHVLREVAPRFPTARNLRLPAELPSTPTSRATLRHPGRRTWPGCPVILLIVSPRAGDHGGRYVGEPSR